MELLEFSDIYTVKKIAKIKLEMVINMWLWRLIYYIYIIIYKYNIIYNNIIYIIIYKPYMFCSNMLKKIKLNYIHLYAIDA